MILRFTDADDDGVAIESAAIVAVSVGRLQKPMSVDDDRDPHEVTVVHTLAGPLVVRQDALLVVQAWQEALTVTPPVKAHPEVMGWLSQYFHPSVLRPEPPAWDAKAISVSKEVEP